MTASIDRETARRQAEDVLTGLVGRRGPQAVTDTLVALEELCGLDRPGRHPGPPSEDALRRLGGVTRAFADQAWRLPRVDFVDTLGLELGDLLATGFRRTDPEEDTDLRSELLRDMWVLVELDLEQARNVFPGHLAKTFRHATTASERQTVETWFREALERYPDDDPQSPCRVAGHWMLEYIGDDLDDEAFEAVCRETGQYARLVERALEEDRGEEAVDWVDRAPARRIADLCWMFYDRDRLSELVEADVFPNPEWEPIPADEMYDTVLMLVDSGEVEEALPWIREVLHEVPLGKSLWEIRDTAEEAGVYDHRLEEALLEDARAHWPEVVFDFHLEFGELGDAAELWETVESWSDRQRGRAADGLIEAAEKHGAPDVLLAAATEQADFLIARRGRDNYADACDYLARARRAVESGELPVDWSTIIDEYEDRLDRLPAFRDEAQKAGLLEEGGRH